jgi:hypothetical protein
MFATNLPVLVKLTVLCSTELEITELPLGGKNFTQLRGSSTYQYHQSVSVTLKKTTRQPIYIYYRAIYHYDGQKLGFNRPKLRDCIRLKPPASIHTLPTIYGAALFLWLS